MNQTNPEAENQSLMSAPADVPSAVGKILTASARPDLNTRRFSEGAAADTPDAPSE